MTSQKHSVMTVGICLLIYAVVCTIIFTPIALVFLVLVSLDALRPWPDEAGPSLTFNSPSAVAC